MVIVTNGIHLVYTRSKAILHIYHLLFSIRVATDGGEIKGGEKG